MIVILIILIQVKITIMTKKKKNSNNSDIKQTIKLVTIQNKLRYSEIVILKTCRHYHTKTVDITMYKSKKPRVGTAFNNKSLRSHNFTCFSSVILLSLLSLIILISIVNECYKNIVQKSIVV